MGSDVGAAASALACAWASPGADNAASGGIRGTRRVGGGGAGASALGPSTSRQRGREGGPAGLMKCVLRDAPWPWSSGRSCSMRFARCCSKPDREPQGAILHERRRRAALLLAILLLEDRVADLDALVADVDAGRAGDAEAPRDGAPDDDAGLPPPPERAAGGESLAESSDGAPVSWNSGGRDGAAVERTLARLSRCRGILIRWDKKARCYLAHLKLACALL